MNRDGTHIDYFAQSQPLFESNNRTQMRQLVHTIVHNAFTPAERQRLRGATLDVTLYINSHTGSVDDVQFVFWIDRGFATIPVSTYRRIELELKNRIRFAPTAEGRRRNFLIMNIEYRVG
jgi:hypothetical protein